MCGIAGIYTPGRPVTLEGAMPMLQALSHRGPDGQGHFVEQDLALLHARLSIIDLEEGKQPLFSQSGQLALVANGEIYNHVELRREVEARGATFSTRSDCEVILPFAERESSAFPDQFRGMFAFALFDRLSRRLTLVRDRFGIKPLYYMEVPGGIAFASETKALLALAKGALAVDEAAVQRFMQVNFASGDQTAFARVKRVPPGGELVLDANGRMSLGQWWNLEEEVARRPVFAGDSRAAVEEFDGLMHRSVMEHRRADVPVGLFLSGGTDSSTLAMKMADCPEEASPRAWSVGFDSEAVHDELDAAKEVAVTCKIDLTPLRINPVKLFDHLVYAVWATDELMGDFACLPTFYLASQAASASHKVVFMGEGGDEAFAGYGRYRMPAPQRWFYALRSPGSGGFRTRGRFDKKLPSAWLRPEWRRTMEEGWRLPFQQAWQATAGLDELTRRQVVDMQTWLVDDLLVKADRMLMAKGVEGRVPFLDQDVALFGLTLPPALKIQSRYGKQVPRAWLQQRGNTRALGRKRGFSVPVTDWVQSLDRGRLLEALQRSLLLQSVIDPRRLEETLRQPGPLHKSTIEPLAALVQLAIWARLFIEGEGSEPPEKVDPLAWLLS